MSKIVAFVGAIALTFALAEMPAYAADGGPYKLDAKGGCHAASGKYAKKEMCSAPAAKPKCRDIKTKKYAKCGAPGTEAVPAKP